MLSRSAQRDAKPQERSFAEEALFHATVDAARPDPLRRLWRAFHGAVKQPSPVLVSLADGHEAGNRAVRALAMMRGRAGTHGSMTRSSSLGVFASNWRDVTDVDSWRACTALFGPVVLQAAREAGAERIAQASERAPAKPVAHERRAAAARAALGLQTTTQE